MSLRLTTEVTSPFTLPTNGSRRTSWARWDAQTVVESQEYRRYVGEGPALSLKEVGRRAAVTNFWSL